MLSRPLQIASGRILRHLLPGLHKPFSPAVVKARVRTHIFLREARVQLAHQFLALNTELEMARKIQLSILPQDLPKLPRLSPPVTFLLSEWLVLPIR